jgi:type I restriction enzyme M protein
MAKKNGNGEENKSLEAWIWDAACSIRGAQEAPKYKNFILPLIFTKRLCDVFDDEINRIAKEVGSRAKAFKWVEHDKKVVRFYIPLKPKDTKQPVWSVIRGLSDKIGETLTSYLIDIGKANPKLDGIINRIDFNATTHGQRDIDDDRLSNLIEKISKKRLGLKDVEPDIIGRSYEYLIRKFAEGGGQSAGEFYTPAEVGWMMASIMRPEPGMEIYDPTCGSAGLLIKCELEMERLMNLQFKTRYAPLQLYGQEYTPETYAMAWMNMIIHDMEGIIEIGDTFRNPKFRIKNRLRTFDRVVANPMWNQDWFTINDYDNDELGRFPDGAGFPGKQSGDWGWVQIIYSSLNENGRAAIVLDTGGASRGSGNANTNKEKDVRKWFVDNDLVEGVVYLPENLFYNTSAPGIVLVLNKNKPKNKKGKFFLMNASKHFEKGDPKNYIPQESIAKLADVFNGWIEEEKLSKIVTLEEIKKNDYNISPSRYIQVNEAETYRPIGEIIGDLKDLEKEAETVEGDLKEMLVKIGIDY